MSNESLISIPSRDRLRAWLRDWWPVPALLLPVLLLGGSAYWLAARSIALRVHSNQATATDLTGLHLQDFFRDRVAIALNLLELPSVQAALAQGRTEPLRERMAIVRHNDPYLSRVSFADGQGRLWCAEPNVPALIGKEFRFRQWYQGVSRTGLPFLSGVYTPMAPLNGSTITLAVPQLGPRGLEHVLLFQYSLPDLARLSSQVPVGGDGWLLLIDSQGQVVMDGRAVPQERFMAAYRNLEGVQRALAGRPSSASFRDPVDGREVVASFAPLQLLGQDWVVAALQPRSTVFELLRSLAWQLAAAAALMTLLGTVLTLRLQEAHLRTRALNRQLEGQNQSLRQLTTELNREVGARREAEAGLRALQTGLEEQVEQRTAQLAQKERELQQIQRLESIGRLAGGVAHDFNNLLTVVMGNAELLETGGWPEPVREQARLIRKASERGSRLTRQLLAFARRQPGHPQAVTLDQVVQDARALLQPLLGEAVKLELQLEEGLPPVLADPGQLEQALINLAMNARDALPPQGGRICISTRRVRPDDPVLDPPEGPGRGHCVVLSVSDNGSGIDAAVLPSIFEPFFTTKPVGQGTGLGLPMVQNVVRQAGGQISVHSLPGEGAEFRLFLPLALSAPVAEEGAAAAPGAPPAKPGTRVLLVEDEPALRQLVEQLLRGAGDEVRSAGDPAAALALARDGSADLLLSDRVMPGGDGADLALTLQTQWPQLRVLLMSGYHDSPLPDPGRLRFQFLAKPFRPPELLEAVRQVLA